MLHCEVLPDAATLEPGPRVAARGPQQPCRDLPGDEKEHRERGAPNEPQIEVPHVSIVASLLGGLPALLDRW